METMSICSAIHMQYQDDTGADFEKEHHSSRFWGFFERKGNIRIPTNPALTYIFQLCQRVKEGLISAVQTLALRCLDIEQQRQNDMAMRKPTHIIKRTDENSIWCRFDGAMVELIEWQLVDFVTPGLNPDPPPSWMFALVFVMLHSVKCTDNESEAVEVKLVKNKNMNTGVNRR